MTKILVVDDSLTDLTRIQQILSDVGHTVITATSGAEAIGKAQSERPDIIFLDVVMEGTNGFQACREIKKQADMNAVPVFLVTSKSQRVDHMYAKQVGASGLMPKPYESQQILDCLKAL
ncbi:response regulator [Thiocystis violacea]|uniref:response regulator n=1 Tax=Thiocystis violacea TaxID=13725 RepID=UPI001907B664|nr:response regulator [Thiocystis violacea]MBK1722956.1 hypothetical protein [Thiocystis violacea]